MGYEKISEIIKTSKQGYINTVEVIHSMGKRNNNNRGLKASTSVNPQGISPDAEAGDRPKTQLEERAKKRNTR
jgi:small acid-soluble spore protein L (minor)